MEECGWKVHGWSWDYFRIGLLRCIKAEALHAQGSSQQGSLTGELAVTTQCNTYSHGHVLWCEVGQRRPG